MKKLLTFAIIIVLIAYKSEANKDTKEVVKNEPKKEVVTQNNSKADYSTLFDTYNCDVSIEDLAKVLQIPASDITLGKNPKAEHCLFQLKGFGEGYENEGTYLSFGPSFSTKNQNKKVITESLKEKAEMPNEKMFAGRDIVLADAGDCYILIQSGHGRALLLNENYERLFKISYGNRASVQGRTEEQHKLVTEQVKDLANYLVTKHKN